MINKNQQEDLEAELELAREEMDKQLYQPAKSIEHLNVEELLNDTTQLFRALDSMKVNEMMLIRGSDRPQFFNAAGKLKDKKFISRWVKIPLVINGVTDPAKLKAKGPQHRDSFVAVKRIK